MTIELNLRKVRSAMAFPGGNYLKWYADLAIAAAIHAFEKGGEDLKFKYFSRNDEGEFTSTFMLECPAGFIACPSKVFAPEWIERLILLSAPLDSDVSTFLHNHTPLGGADDPFNSAIPESWDVVTLMQYLSEESVRNIIHNLKHV